MTTIEIKTTGKENEITRLVMSAIESKIARIEIGIETTRKRLAQFESRYKIPSERFIRELSAEDIEGKDIEYTEWAGEYKILQRLMNELERLQEIECVGGSDNRDASSPQERYPDRNLFSPA